VGDSLEGHDDELGDDLEGHGHLFSSVGHRQEEGRERRWRGAAPIGGGAARSGGGAARTSGRKETGWRGGA
jgi:hypothetical protein